MSSKEVLRLVDLQLDVHDAELQGAVAGLGQSINDWRGAWVGVAEVVRGIVREQFESEGARGPLGGWAPLNKAYAARKAKEHAGKPLMRSTDRLYDSLTGDSPDAVFEATAQTLILGTRVPYAAFSQSSPSGSSSLSGQSGEPGGENRPQRALYDLAEQDGEAVAAPLQTAARAVAEKLGFATSR